LDRFGRIVDMPFTIGSATLDNAMYRYQYGYDASGNRKYARIKQKGWAAPNLRDNQHSYLYAYDAFNRLTSADFGALDTSNTGITAVDGSMGYRWGLDVLGNWSGDGAVAGYQELSLYPTITPTLSRDDMVNALNQIDEQNVSTSPETISLDYDPAGNLIDDGTHTYKYDAFNKLSEVRKSDGSPVSWHYYDALGRRVGKQVANSGLLNTPAPDLFYYEGDRLVWQRVAKEQESGGGGGGGGGEGDPELPPPGGGADKVIVYEDGDSAPNATSDLSDNPKLATRASTIIVYNTHREFIWGLEYVDELLAQITPPSPTTGGPEVYDHVLQDANYNVVALIDPSGAMRYQYRYHPYGRSTGYENSSGQSSPPLSNTFVRNATSFGPWGFWFDQETQLINARNRTIHSTLGRPLQPDPNGDAFLLATAQRMNARTAQAFARFSQRGIYPDGMSRYEWLSSNPITGHDPTGLFPNISEQFMKMSIQGGLMGMLLGAIGDALFNPQSTWQSKIAATGAGGLAGLGGAATLAWAGTASLAGIVAAGMVDGGIYSGLTAWQRGAPLAQVYSEAATGAWYGGLSAGVIGYILKAFTGPMSDAAEELTRSRKALAAEGRARETLLRAGYAELPARLPSDHGFDGVFVKSQNGQVVDIIITESKLSSTGRAYLTNTKTMGQQLSPQWIRANIDKMQASADPAIQQVGDFLHANFSLIRTKFNVMGPDMINHWTH
jgi:YD repeat-containing protein